MMKRITAVLLGLLLLAGAACCAAEEVRPEVPDGDWNLPESIEMTEEASALFAGAMEGLTGVTYEPAGFLGEKDGVYCILCRATAVYPGAKPYYALVYVSGNGLENIWEIWMDAHATTP